MARNRRYYWFNDDYLFYVRGYEKYYSTYKDGSKFFVQLRDAQAYFSVLRQDIEKHFVIEHPDKQLEKILNDYFIRNLYRMTSGKLFSNAYGLLDFFANSYQQTALFGEMFYFIDWQSKDFSGQKYRIPDSFDYIHPETMKCKKDRHGNITGFRQKYSFYTRKKHSKDEREVKTVEFKSWEIFYTVYPLGKPHPVKKSLKFIKHFTWFLKYMVWSGEAGAYSRPRTWAVEKTRDMRFEDEKRKHYILTAKANKNFNTPLGVNDLNITCYYDFFYYARFKSDIYKARLYYVEAFNEQVLKPFAKKNNLTIAPTLKMFDMLTEIQIEEYFEQWKAGTFSKDDFLAKVVRAD